MDYVDKIETILEVIDDTELDLEDLITDLKTWLRFEWLIDANFSTDHYYVLLDLIPEIVYRKF